MCLLDHFPESYGVKLLVRGLVLGFSLDCIQRFVAQLPFGVGVQLGHLYGPFLEQLVSGAACLLVGILIEVVRVIR